MSRVSRSIFKRSNLNKNQEEGTIKEEQEGVVVEEETIEIKEEWEKETEKE